MKLKNLFASKKDREEKVVEPQINNTVQNVSGGSTVSLIINHYHRDDDTEARKSAMDNYLDSLMIACAKLDWFNQIAYKDEKTGQIRLDAVYTALLTKTENRQENEPYSAVEMLNLHDRLVLAGDPGGGKSAFVNFVALCMAGELLDKAHCNLALLKSPLPDEDGMPRKQMQIWEHDALVPLRIILRDFASSPFFPKDGTAVMPKSLLDFIRSDLAEHGKEKFFPTLEKLLADGNVLLMFDGLDEVADAGKRREAMKNAIAAFYEDYPKNRFLVTVRPYAYEKKKWQLDDFTATELARFSRGQIAVFIDGWYRDCPELDEGEPQRRAAQLKQAIMDNPTLYELAERPLLLTLIGFLHRNRHELPERRADLYERLLSLLIEKWETARFKVVENGGAGAEKALELKQKGLADYLQVGFPAIQEMLERLAFNAHARQDKNEKGTADIAASDLNHALYCLAKAHGGRQDINPVDIGNYLRDRVGILYQRGGNSDLDAVYSFPHRSFQEYLAACYFERGEDALYKFCEEAEDWWEIAAHLGIVDYDRWREVVVLAGAIHAGSEAMANLLKALYENIIDSEAFSDAQEKGLILAGDIFQENRDKGGKGKKLKKCQKNFQDLLQGLLETQKLEAKERVRLNRHLGKIGDCRAELLEVDKMQFCMVPAGEFYLGSDDRDSMAFDDEKKNAGWLNIDKAYAMSRFPLTVAQYRQFVTDTGHKMVDARCLRGVDNTPVVYVTWNEAMAFCEWLTKRWQKLEYLPEDWKVTLPSEPEWEKAARGGREIPVAEKIVAIGDNVCQHLGENLELMNNPFPQRIYPWGKEIDVERLNYDKSGIDTVSTLGCYPLGKSPYGCEEMAGNVWEWTRSAYHRGYPIKFEEWKKRNTKEQSNVRRVLRGGGFFYSGADVRCAMRYSYTQGFRFNFSGFRLVLSPFL